MNKLLRVIAREQCIGCYSCMYACSRTWFKASTIEKAALRVKNYAGSEGAFSIRPCYGCLNPDCANACPVEALTPKEGGGVKFDPEKCVNCRKCVDACISNAMQWDFETSMPLICHQCGVCTKFCPNQVIAMVDIDRNRKVEP
ncbi:MAG TPA: (Fe-S)-binding protein [Candidatus Riflebacteria bacterium]|jgi:Fe-S-cluster-containing dehydrogenase component|nr:(Fe-S)-binding protein [Candidatus Riflebacteria bacterium]